MRTRAEVFNLSVNKRFLHLLFFDSECVDRRDPHSSIQEQGRRRLGKQIMTMRLLPSCAAPARSFQLILLINLLLCHVNAETRTTTTTPRSKPRNEPRTPTTNILLRYWFPSKYLPIRTTPHKRQPTSRRKPQQQRQHPEQQQWPRPFPPTIRSIRHATLVKQQTILRRNQSRYGRRRTNRQDLSNGKIRRRQLG